MLKTALAGVRSHSRRFVGTVLAVVLGVGFVTGTLIFGDTTREGYFEAFARGAHNADAVVVSPSAQDIARMRTVSEVDEMDVRVEASLPLLDRQNRPITNFGQVGMVVATDGPARLRAFDLEGRVPVAGAREALLDKETAAQQRVAVGDRVTVIDAGKQRVGYQVVGLMDFRVSKAFAGSSVVGLPAAEIEALTGVAEVREVVVSARPGVSQERLAEALRAVVKGEGAEVVTGEQRRLNLADQATSVAKQLTMILLIFGAISLLVAVFVIYNTFAILLAQRIRETALLRCVGASRRQVLGSILAEAVIVGLAGSAAGLPIGIGVAHLLPLAFLALNNDIPAHDVVLTPSSLLIGLAIGLAATILAALLPALRATRVPPMAALRTLPAVLPGRRRLPRILLTVIVGGLGIAVTVLGWRLDDSLAGTFVIVAGGVIVFLGVLIAAPLFLGGLTAAVSAPLRPFAGATLRLAVANARRNPGRSAVTAAALMVGIGLMALFSVLISSVEATADDQIAVHYPVDYVISSAESGSDGRAGGVPQSLATQLRTHNEFTSVIEARATPVDVGVGVEAGSGAGSGSGSGSGSGVGSGSGSGVGVPGGEFGMLGALSEPAQSGVLVSRKRPWAKTLQAGDTVVVSLGGKEFPLTIAGFTDTSVPGVGAIDLRVPWQQFVSMAGPGDDSAVMVKARDEVTVVASRDILDSYRAQYPLLEISSIADLADDLETQVAGLIGLFGGLLGLTVLIALFGIANTLSLSVVERTRESATMRAMGLTRGQLRATLLYEAVLLGVVAGVVGVAFGVLFGRIVVLKALSDVGATVLVPWGWVAGLLGLAAVAAVVAGILPARRAAGTSIVAAMGDDA